MLESLYILLGIVAVWYILYWSIRNDKAKSIGEQTGWLRMKNDGPDRDAKAAERKGRWKRRGTAEREEGKEERGRR